MPERVADGKVPHARTKSLNTVAYAGQMLRTSVLPVIGKQWVDRTTTKRLETLFKDMAARDYATSTIDRTWNYLNQALQFAVRQRMTKTNPAAAVLLPERRASKERKSFTIEEDQRLLGLYDPETFVFCTRTGTPMSTSNLRRAFQQLCERAGLGKDWTTYEYELRHSFVSLVVNGQLDDLVKVADLAGHVDTRTTQGYRHPVRASLPHAVEAWDRLLKRADKPPAVQAG